ncbi:SAVED domain-containing protein [Leptolyngbya sp. AN02str]|uniref:SAVED domain-containing protein n=1 Tax=Leptolyngbya sp. AN02str TaxID=3423363 RepID=UPI003D31830A
MARAIAARNQGDDYQARWFWFQACRLFGDRTKVVRVVYEANNIKSFDDISVYFDGRFDEEGNPLHAEYYQVKFHVTSAGALTWENLIDPSFINATSVSLLERLRDAQKKYAPRGTEAHFILHSPWTVHPDDLLAKIHSESDGRLDWHRLAEGGSRSELGKVRAAWRAHLGIKTDEELRIILRPLRIRQGRTLQELAESLNDKLFRAGLRPVDENCLCHPYDDLIRKLLQYGKTEFTHTDIKDICKRENLWMGHSAVEPTIRQIGIRSFLRWAENLEDETDAMLDLLRWFDGRNIRSPELWQEIYPNIESFLSKELRPSQRYDFHLHAHASIAFAVGYCVDSKSGIDAAVVQSTRAGRQIWRPSLHINAERYPSWTASSELISQDETDTAVALCVTHNVTADIRHYIERENLPIGRILAFSLPSGSNQSSILDADHAKLLAEQLAALLREQRTGRERQGKLHLFVAAPNALVFFIGQVSRSFGSCVFYEYDFDSNAPGAYQPSLAFPPSK